MAITNRDRDYWSNWIRRKLRDRANEIKDAHKEEIKAVKDAERLKILGGELGDNLRYAVQNAEERKSLSDRIDDLTERRNVLQIEAKEHLNVDRYTYDYVEFMNDKVSNAVEKAAQKTLMETEWAIKANDLLQSEEEYLDAMMYATSSGELRAIVQKLGDKIGGADFLDIAKDLS